MAKKQSADENKKAPKSGTRTGAAAGGRAPAKPLAKQVSTQGDAPAKAVASAKAEATAKSEARAKRTAAGKPSGDFTSEDFRQVEQEERELPLEYGDTKVVLLVRDPEWIFAYWELSEATRRKHGLTRGTVTRSLVLRVFERKDGRDQDPYDVVVNDYTSSWYIRVPHTSDRFRVELGLFDEKGIFRSLAMSNEAVVPRMGISDQVDVEFATIDDEIYEQILHLSGGVKVSERLGSDEFLKSLQQRIFESLFGGPMSSAGLSSAGLTGGISSGLSSFNWGLSSAGLSSGLFASLLSSDTFSSAGLPSAIPHAGADNTVQRKSAQKDDFWLEVGVDVIVYGATEPDAKVSFMGQEIKLNADGTFRFRMVFPDTTIEFPVEAISRNGNHVRKVKPIVSRRTEGDPRKPA